MPPSEETFRKVSYISLMWASQYFKFWLPSNNSEQYTKTVPQIWISTNKVTGEKVCTMEKEKNYSCSWGIIVFVSVYVSEFVLEGGEQNILSDTKCQTTKARNKKFKCHKIIFPIYYYDCCRICRGYKNISLLKLNTLRPCVPNNCVIATRENFVCLTVITNVSF